MLQWALILIVGGGIVEIERWDADADGKNECENAARTVIAESLFSSYYTRGGRRENALMMLDWACVPAWDKTKK